MDMMFWMELAVVIIAIFIGAKWGGAGLGDFNITSYCFQSFEFTISSFDSKA